MCASMWDVFRRTPSRDGRGHRAAMDFVVCFGCAGISCFFFVLFSSNAHGLLHVQVCGRLASFTSLLVIGVHRLALFGQKCLWLVGGFSTTAAVVPNIVRFVFFFNFIFWLQPTSTALGRGVARGVRRRVLFQILGQIYV